jgi:glycosyltransferase involved in cell wall biosynthesis
MNVLILTDKLIMGGAEMYYCKLENYLKHPGLTFYYAAGNGDLYKRIKHKQHFIELSRSRHLQNIKRLISLIQDKEISVIHANSLRMVMYSTCVKKMISRPLKIVYTKHNVTILERKVPHMFRYLLNKHVDRIITVSEFEKENLEEVGIDQNKIKTIYNGVDLEQFLYEQKEKRKVFHIGILARLSEEKNHDLFIDIADHLRDRPNILFHIAGDGPEKQRIADQIKARNLTDKVKMIGEVQNPETFIKEMDVLLLTSYREVFPMVIIESMAVGTPIISIDQGGIKEAVIDGETGILIKNHSTADFCQQILLLESNHQQVLKLIEQARGKVEKDFSLDQMLHQTLEEYLNCS